MFSIPLQRETEKKENMAHEHHHHECSTCEHHHEHHHEEEHHGLLTTILLAAALLGIAVFVEHTFTLPMWQLLLIYLVPYLIVGLGTLKEAVEGLMAYLKILKN